MVVSHRTTRLLLVFVTLFSLALTGGAAQAGSAVQEVTNSSLASFLDTNGFLLLPSGFGGSINAEGWQLVSGENEPPRFAPIRSAGSSSPLGSTGAAAPRVAGDEKWLPGFNVRGAMGVVYAVAAGAGDDVYVGGTFQTIGDVRAGPSAMTFVAKWDGNRWSALGNGFDGVVAALAWDGANNILYAGGTFEFVCGASDSCSTTRVNHIAKWSEGAWSALSYGLNDIVYALALDGNNDLYVGGQFGGYCTSSSTPCLATFVSRIAKWNRSGGSWSALVHGGTGVSGTVRALAWQNTSNTLVVGGDFGTAWGDPARFLARWVPSPVGHGQFCGGVDGNVRALAWDSTHQALFVGGDFDNLYGNGADPGLACGLAANVRVNHIAKYMISSLYWGPLHHGVDGLVYSIVIDAANHGVYAGGDFTHLCTSDDCNSTSDANYIAQWDYSGAGAWSALGTGTKGLVYALALNGGLYAGGSFGFAGDAVAFGIAKWNSPNWSALGSGNGVSPTLILTVAADGKGNIYAGGAFLVAGGVRVNNIAKWDGSAWSALERGFPEPVQAIAVDKDGSIYAGGGFQYTCGDIECSYHGTRVNSVARWDGSGWSAMGSGLSSLPLPVSQVYALALDSQGNLFAGGTIPGICNIIDCSNPPTISRNIVKWIPPSGPWVSVGGGTDGTVTALVVDSANKLYVGGQFLDVCSNPDSCFPWTQVNKIAKWTGTAWERLAFGVDGVVNALAVDRTDKLYVGGSFTKACEELTCVLPGTKLNRIGRWTPGSPGIFEKLGSGVASAVTDLVVDDSNNLFASGVTGLCDNDACGSPMMVKGVAKWNRSVWSPLGSGTWGLVVQVNGLAWQSGRLSVGGMFYGAGDKVSNNLAQYQDNNPPTLAHISKVGPPGRPLPFTVAEFAGAMTDTESEALAKIRVLSLPANGTLKLDGTAVTANQEITAAQLPYLTFSPSASWTGATSFSWNGHDGNSYAVTPANVNITIAFRLLYLPLVRR